MNLLDFIIDYLGAAWDHVAEWNFDRKMRKVNR